MAKKLHQETNPPAKTTNPQPVRHENVIQRAAEEVEARLLEAGEMLTETTSAETNLALAALTAIEGLPDDKLKPAAEEQHGKRTSPVRPKKR